MDKHFVTVAIGTKNERKIPVKDQFRMDWTTEKEICISELEEDQGYLVTIYKKQQQTSTSIWLSLESLVGVNLAITMLLDQKGIKPDEVAEMGAVEGQIKVSSSYLEEKY